MIPDPEAWIRESVPHDILKDTQTAHAEIQPFISCQARSRPMEKIQLLLWSSHPIDTSWRCP